MGSIQILLPFAMMTVIIGLAKLYEEKLGMLLLEGLQGAVQSHTIISACSPCEESGNPPAIHSCDNSGYKE